MKIAHYSAWAGPLGREARTAVPDALFPRSPQSILN